LENCDPDIEEGALWGNKCVIYAVYRSACSIFAYSFSLNEDDKLIIHSSGEFWTDHYTYLSALSKNATGYSLSGDYRGLLVLWNVSDTNSLEPTFSTDVHSKTQITCIEYADHSPDSCMFWVCDISGFTHLLEIDEKTEILIPIVRISSGSYGMRHPTHINYASNDLNRRLRLSSYITKSSIEFNFDVNAKTIFSSNAPIFDDFHKNLVTCLTYVIEFNIIIEASWEGLISFWDCRTGLLLSSLPKKDSDPAVAIASAFVNPNLFYVLSGTQSGLSSFYSVHLHGTEFIPEESMQVFQLLEKEDTTISADKKSYSSVGDGIEIIAGGEQSYSPIPVSDIIFSKYGAYAAICYCRRLLMIHSNLENRPLSQITLDGSVSQVSSFTQESSASSSDSLILVIVASRMIRVLDAIRSEYLFTLDTFAENMLPVSCLLWRNDDEENLSGFFCAKDLSLYYLENSVEKGFVTKQILSKFGNTGNSPVDIMFSGMSFIRDKDSVLLLAWSFRNMVSILLDLSFSEGILNI
jgi:WD40 repeat protein